MANLFVLFHELLMSSDCILNNCQKKSGGMQQGSLPGVELAIPWICLPLKVTVYVTCNFQWQFLRIKTDGLKHTSWHKVNGVLFFTTLSWPNTTSNWKLCYNFRDILSTSWHLSEALRWTDDPSMAHTSSDGRKPAESIRLAATLSSNTASGNEVCLEEGKAR